MTTVFKRFSFDAAHRLPGLVPGHRCGRIHGHTFHLEVRCAGPINPRTGMVVAYEDIKAAVVPVLADLDHHLLNDLPGLEIPTTENLAAYLWHRLQPTLPLLSELLLQETATAGILYRGPETQVSGGKRRRQDVAVRRVQPKRTTKTST
ncbi:MAG: 6-carboxytetrahydropterin synthase QueD [Verrucomicrobia bacterium]|nr:6-carboxytetrahydropterin synthase QueD [Verrucomicrobiota bacterium]